MKHNLFLKEKEVDKLKRVLRGCGMGEVVEKYFETVEKETKFNLLVFSNFENSRKRGELEQILKTLEGEREEYEREMDGVAERARGGAGKGDALRRYVRERVKGELGIVEEMDEVMVLERCIERLREREKRDSYQNKIERLQSEL